MKIALISLSILLGALGQVFLKVAANNTPMHQNMIYYYIGLLTNLFAWLGAISYAGSFILWMYLLKEFDLSYLRPLVSFGYIVTAVLAVIFLGEKIGLIQWIGIVLIVIGVYLVTLVNPN